MNPTRRCGAWAGLLWRDRSGGAAVEAAIILPLMALLLGGAMDVSRYVETTARADRIAIALADMVSRAEKVRDRSTLDASSRNEDTAIYFQLSRELAKPWDLDDRGGVVIASVEGDNGRTEVNWVRESGPGANPSRARLEAIAALPDGMEFIVVEAVLPFDPLLVGVTGALAALNVPTEVRRMSMYRPRVGSLRTLEQP